MDNNSRDLYQEVQYRDSINLSARSQIYRSFSKNPQSFHCWAFNHLRTKVERDVLELGCGPGNFWKANATEIPTDWRISLLDLSIGMIREAKQSLDAIPTLITYIIGDAQQIPLVSNKVDVVIANHMLYHIPHITRALSEITRVLHPGGWLFAATNGRDHLREMRALVYEIDEEIDFGFRDAYGQEELSFSLENGLEQLQREFVNVRLYTFDDALLITEVEPVINYIASYHGNARLKLSQGDTADHLRARIVKAIDEDGVFWVTTSAGLFVAQRE